MIKKGMGFYFTWSLALASFVISIGAQEIVVPDAGLNAAVREALHKPTGPLTSLDLLTLTTLDASKRNVSSLAGLEAAVNLSELTLRSNQLSNLTLPASLTNLATVDLNFNPMTNCVFPDSLAKLNRVLIEFCELTNVTLPANLTTLLELNLYANRLPSFTVPPSLTGIGALILSANAITNVDLGSNLTELDNLDLEANSLTDFTLPPKLTNIVFLSLDYNSLTNCTLPESLPKLNTLNVSGNELSRFQFPTNLPVLITLDLSVNHFTNFALPAGIPHLLSLDLFYNQLTSLTLPNDLTNLVALQLDNNLFQTLALPPNLIRLTHLHLGSNLLSNFRVPSDMASLLYLDLAENQLTNLFLPVTLGQLGYVRIAETKLTSLHLPVGLTNLVALYLRSNQLTNLTLEPDMGKLTQVDFLANQIANLNLPSGLTNLLALYASGNQISALTLPPDLSQLNSLVLNGNPVTTLVLSEAQAASNATQVADLRGQGVSVHTYPTTLKLESANRKASGDFEFTISGPPGVYSTFGSGDLTNWNVLTALTNQVGSVPFSESATATQRFFRASLREPPADMVFIPPNTFTMGSPVTEQDRSSDEGPQTVVTLTHGFWIGKHEVTQAEYVSIMNINPSDFPGDLRNPVSSVSFLDATNYCWLLTQRERAAGRISSTSQYRLPTEAEWECAARAGTTTRFSFGDDPTYSEIPQHGWFGASPLTVHPVGQKLPNPWGLYDMEGNVWEWCQDWYGPLPGGSVIDPKGPPTNPIGFKVMRGGAYDYFNNDCRSARRLFFGAPTLTDSDLGIRVVLEE